MVFGFSSTRSHQYSTCRLLSSLNRPGQVCGIFSTTPPPHSGQVHRAGDESRPAVEAFIADVYRARYGAAVRAFAPTLVSLRDVDGEIVAAAGYRSAAEGVLFLERYLGIDPSEMTGGPADD